MYFSSLGTCPWRAQRARLDAILRFRFKSCTLRSLVSAVRYRRRLGCPLHLQTHKGPFDASTVECDVVREGTTLRMKIHGGIGIEKSRSVYAPEMQKVSAHFRRNYCCSCSSPSTRHFYIQAKETGSSACIDFEGYHAAVECRSVDAHKERKICASSLNGYNNVACAENMRRERSMLSIADVEINSRQFRALYCCTHEMP